MWNWLRTKINSQNLPPKMAIKPQIQSLEPRLLLDGDPIHFITPVQTVQYDEGSVVKLDANIDNLSTPGAGWESSQDFLVNPSNSDPDPSQGSEALIRTTREFEPFLSSDGNTLYFTSTVYGSSDVEHIFMRDLTTGAEKDISPDLWASSATSSVDFYSPWLSADNQRLYYSTDQGGGHHLSIWMSEWDSINNKWGAGQEFYSLNESPTSEYGSVTMPSLSSDENTMLYSKNVSGHYELYLATRVFDNETKGFEDKWIEQILPVGDPNAGESILHNINFVSYIANNDIININNRHAVLSPGADEIHWTIYKDTQFQVYRAELENGVWTRDTDSIVLPGIVATNDLISPSYGPDGKLYISTKAAGTPRTAWEVYEITPNSIQVTAASADINWGDGNAVETVSITNGKIETDHVYGDNDDYTITVTVTYADTESTTVTDSTLAKVNNVAPTADSFTITDTIIDENGMVTVNGTFSDPGSLDTHTVDIHWGDTLGTVTAATVNQGAGTFTAQFQYKDDDPTGTAQDQATITATISDDDGGTTSASTTVTINNVAPEITSVTGNAGWDVETNIGDLVNLTVDFTDQGTLDSHTVSIDWGDGTVETQAVAAGSRTHAATHAYATGGLFAAQITVNDDDTGSDNATITSVIIGAGIQGGILNVIGSNADEKITVTPDCNDASKLNVTIRQKDSGVTQTYPVDAAVTSIDVYARGGNDMVIVSHAIDNDTQLDGGTGNDIIYGGRGVDTILGGDGNDSLFGRAGNDIIDGGLGDDRLWGNYGDDILHGGEGNDKLFGGAGVDHLYGDAGNDYIWGSLGDDYMYGGLGNDVLIGGEGDDELYGEDGNDWLDGGAGADLIVGGTGDDVLLGGAGNDMLLGEDGNDLLFGGSGDDDLQGGNGDDLLVGGPGNDSLSGDGGLDLLIDGWAWCWEA